MKQSYFISITTLSLFLLIGAGCNSEKTMTPAASVPQNGTTSDEVLTKEVTPPTPAITTLTPTPEPTVPMPVTSTTEPAPAPITPPPASAEAPTSKEDQTIPSVMKEFSITAKNWEFVPSTITVHKGDTVKLQITSVDVDHGFFLSAFGISRSLKPGQTATAEFVADKTGSFPFFCNVFCGSGHQGMNGTLIVQ